MGYAAHLHREIRSFESAARLTAGAKAAPLIPSCPGWSASDLMLHLGGVHRYVTLLLQELPAEQPDPADIFYLGLPADIDGWPRPEHAPNRGPLPTGLLDWFAAGAALLVSHFRSSDPRTEVWTWSGDRSVGFWLRIQAIEAAVHRWDMEGALGAARPVDGELAADAVGHFIEVMMPASRSRKPCAPGAGERYRFRRTDGRGVWTVYFEGDDVRLAGAPGEPRPSDAPQLPGASEPYDVELSGTASELMLFLWGRIPRGPATGRRRQGGALPVRLPRPARVTRTRAVDLVVPKQRTRRRQAGPTRRPVPRVLDLPGRPAPPCRDPAGSRSSAH